LFLYLIQTGYGTLTCLNLKVMMTTTAALAAAAVVVQTQHSGDATTTTSAALQRLQTTMMMNFRRGVVRQQCAVVPLPSAGGLATAPPTPRLKPRRVRAVVVVALVAAEAALVLVLDAVHRPGPQLVA
jgi:hypothetical protein